MYYSSPLIAATLVLQASAFLIPPNIAEIAPAVDRTLYPSNIQIFEVDCPGCPFAGFDEDHIQWEEGVENKIQLIFGTADEQLQINGHAVYPNAFVFNPGFPLSARQVRASDSKLSVPIPLGFVVEYLQSVSDEEESGQRIIPLEFTILDLKGLPVKVETVHIDLVEAEQPPRHQLAGTTHELTIAKLFTVPFYESPGALECDTSSKWAICRIRAIIAARLQEMIESAKERANAAKTWMKGSGCTGKKDGGHKKHGEHGHGHRHHRGHRFLHRMGKFMHQAMRFFIVPALLGVIGGLMASAVGMLVGQAIVYMWIHFHRRGQRGPLRLIEVTVVEDEKDALMTDETPPDYRDVEEYEVTDEKK